MSAGASQGTAMPSLAGFIVANVAVMVIVLAGIVAPPISLDLALPPWYPPFVVFLGSAFAVVVAVIRRSARRAYGVDVALLIMTGINLVAGGIGLTGPWAPNPAEHVEADWAAVVICVLLLIAILLGRAQRPASG